MVKALRWIRERFALLTMLAFTLFLGGLLLIGLIGSRQADAEAKTVVRQLERSYRRDSDRPSVPLVRAYLFGSVNDADIKFAMPKGVERYKVGVEAGSVHLVARGVRRAAGWCFVVDYEDGRDAIVSSTKCS